MIPDDTIVAVSTAAGNADRAIVRLSGPRSVELAQQVFVRADQALSDLAGFRACDGIVRFSLGTVRGIREAKAAACAELPARAYLFRAPRSFTRQDVVELHLPGSAVAAAALAAQLEPLGARSAQPGEFTARAFFSGRLDLSAAEAVADIIDAADEAHLRSAVSTLGGHVARLCQTFASTLADELALTEAAIDLADEDIQLDAPTVVGARLQELAAGLSQLAASAADMPETFHLPRVVLCGYPNAGKSSLLNALAGQDRAIVSPVANTTRDVLSAQVVLGSHAVLLQDAAGFSGRRGGLLQAADAAAHAAVAAADVVLLMADLTQDHDMPALLAHVRAVNRRCPVLLLGNKADALADAAASDKTQRLAQALDLPAVAVSARTGQNLDLLLAELAQRLHLGADRSGGALALHQRQKQCLLQASQAAARAADLLARSVTLADQAELTAIELREALAQLGGISGQVVTEDILGRIFARFCVGK